MPRGGARTGAGRPKVNSVERQELILDELLIPAFHFAIKDQIIHVGADEIEKAYGRQGLREWQTWFELIQVGHGLGADLGGVKTTWKLKLKLAVGAKKLIQTVKAEELIFPGERLRQVRNRKAYDNEVKVFELERAKLKKEFGTVGKDYPAYDPTKNYVKHFHTEVNDKGVSRKPLSDLTKGWCELIEGGNNGFTTKSEEVLQDLDVPY